MENILKTYDLSKSYGRIQAVNGLNITIPESSVYAILGPNGSGKSTTLGMILHALKPSAGHFEWFNKEPDPKDLKHIGALLEQPKFYMYLSAMDNLAIVATIKDVSADGIKDSLKKVGLYDRRLDPVKTYSMGMRQRLGIAAAIFHKPKALILDEPTNGLDPQGIADVRQLIINLANDGLSIILASHLLHEVEMVSSHVCILKEGNCMYEGKVSGLKDSNENIIQLGSSNLDSLKSALSDFNRIIKIDKHESDKYLIVHLQKDVQIDDITNHLVQKGIVLNHLTEQSSSLEDEFIELLKE
ncbi:MAG TPA: ATP-binding cassette domain-containing protein [Bacteroidetes bacterium]|nr:ATP-binding cassette domain-containing protein [Bacteroidota bacterium]